MVKKKMKYAVLCSCFVKLSLVNSNINSKMYGCHFVMHAKMTVYFINMS